MTNKPKQRNAINRRNFLKLVLGTGIVGTTAQFASIQKALAADPGFSDYKALVCVFMKGGNDSFNMFIPSGNTPNKGYTDYESIRGNLAVGNTNFDLSGITSTNTNLNNGILGTGSNNPYISSSADLSAESAYTSGMFNLSSKGIDLGVNGVMPELAQLITDNKASIIANAGTLVKPVNRTQILANSAELPLFLFAHNHQQRILQTGQADNLSDIGWAGKIADAWTGINNNSPLGLNISYSSNDRMLIGNQTTPLVLRPGTPPRYSEMILGNGNSHEDRRALFKALMGIENSSPSGNVEFDTNNTFTTSGDFKRLYASSMNKSLTTFDTLYNTWNSNELTYTSTGSYGEPLFSNVPKADLGFDTDIKGSLISQLDAVAKMIHLGASGAFEGSAFNRQLFFVSLGSFDTHSAQASTHPLLLRELSLALWKFQKAMEELGHSNKVTTFTMSDFGRSMTNNGDGTDHAWGAHHIVMGGDGQNTSGNFKGGQMIGSLPDITLEGADDHDKKGRIIPGIAQDQLNATLCHWFGVSERNISSIFSNLSNFESQSGVVSSAYLNDLFVS